jgi:hypothetical protein
VRIVSVLDLIFRVSPGAGDDQEEMTRLLILLHNELLEEEVQAIQLIAEDVSDDGAKGISTVANALALRLGFAGLKAVLAKIGDWASRNGRSVEVTINGDTVKVTGISREQQDKLINVWLARHGVAD